MNDDKIEQEAMDRASAYYGIPRPDADSILRKSLMFACWRLRISVRELFREFMRPFRRFFK